jgi:hypothetical protein
VVTAEAEPLRFTLDTSSIIHVAQDQLYRPEIDELVILGRSGAVRLYLTGAFELDMERAREDRLAANLEWLRGQPIVRVPQPWRFNMSPFGDAGHGFLAGEHKGALERLEASMLPLGLQPGKFDPASEPDKQAKFRKKVADVQHLAGHLMSGNDYFVTSDEDDMLKPSKRKRIFDAAAIRIINPREAIALARRVQYARP